MLRKSLYVGVCVLMLANLAWASTDSKEFSSQDPAVAGDSTGPAENGSSEEYGFTPGQAEFRIPIDGCAAQVSCGSGFGVARCVSWSWGNCFEYPAPDLFVVCDGVARYCPNSPWLP